MSDPTTMSELPLGPMPGPDSIVTCGHWATEPEAEGYLVDFLNRTGLFAVYRQARGHPLCQRHFQALKSVRADLLLVPDARLLAAGWNGGVIVVEAKRSGEKIGPGLSQLLDYLNVAWPIEGGICVLPTFGFLFPAPHQGGPVASIMAQQHIGVAHVHHGGLEFWCGESRVLTVYKSGDVRLGHVNTGRGLGAR